MNIYTCALCNFTTHDVKLLGRHLHYFHKDITKQQYYDVHLGGASSCVVCGGPSKFKNLSIGYTQTCSYRCATTLQWQNDDGTRIDKATKRLTENNIGILGARKGRKNKQPYPTTEAVLNRYANNPPPDWTGKKHTYNTKRKMSDTRLALMATGDIKIMASYKGTFKPQNPQKYRGDPTNIIYRSRWELMLMSRFDLHPDVISWNSEEIKIPYISPIDGKRHTYFPDFWVRRKNASDGRIVEVLIEVKPNAQTKPPTIQQKPTKRYITEVKTWGVNSAKWEAARAYCKQKGWEFQIITERELGLKF